MATLTCTFMPRLPYRGKKSRGKVTKFFASDKFFTDEIFLRLSFSRPVFFADIFSFDKEFMPIFLSRIIIIISHVFAKFIITIFKMYFKHF